MLHPGQKMGKDPMGANVLSTAAHELRMLTERGKRKDTAGNWVERSTRY